MGIYSGSDNFNSLGKGLRRHGQGFAIGTFKCGSSRTLGDQYESVISLTNKTPEGVYSCDPDTAVSIPELRFIHDVLYSSEKATIFGGPGNPSITSVRRTIWRFRLVWISGMAAVR